MTHRKTRFNGKRLTVSVAISIAMLAGGLLWIDGLTLQLAAARLLWPLARLMGFIMVGLFVGQLLEASGWTGMLAWAARPFFRFGRLGDRCAAAFMAAFVSGVTANAMLLDYYQEGNISRKQLFLSNFINQFPAFFLHLPTTFFIVIPLTGWAGGLYFLITFVAVVLRTFGFLVYGHLNPAMQVAARSGAYEPLPDTAPKRSVAFWQIVSQKLPRRLSGVTVYIVPIYIAVFLVNSLGVFAAARTWMAQFATSAVIPVESLSLVVLSFAAEFTSGFAAAGALMDAGVLTVKQTVIALLIGNIIAFPIRAVRHQLPRYMGIFAPKMGLQLLLLGQSWRIGSLIVVGTAFYYVA